MPPPLVRNNWTKFDMTDPRRLSYAVSPAGPQQASAVIARAVPILGRPEWEVELFPTSLREPQAVVAQLAEVLLKTRANVMVRKTDAGQRMAKLLRLVASPPYRFPQAFTPRPRFGVRLYDSDRYPLDTERFYGMIDRRELVIAEADAVLGHLNEHKPVRADGRFGGEIGGKIDALVMVSSLIGRKNTTELKQQTVEGF